MDEFRGFWRYPPTTFLRIFYPREKHGGGMPTKPTNDLYEPLCIGITKNDFYLLKRPPSPYVINCLKIKYAST
jgi:hypothetical protein